MQSSTLPSYADDEDYVLTIEILEFSSSATRFGVDISIVDNLAREGVEQFSVLLSLLTPGTDTQISPAEATIQIIDNDGMQLQLVL